MKWPGILCTLFVSAATALAQGPNQSAIQPTSLTPVAHESVLAPAEMVSDGDAGPGGTGDLAGTHQFDNFIGFISNPFFNIDPRALTALYPLTSATWFSTLPALPNGNIWIPPAGALTVAFSDGWRWA
jgi:hypothetical protein